MNLKHKIIRWLGGVPADYSTNITKHAESEMAIAWPESDDMQDLMKSNILDLCAVFAEQGHSGMSAGYANSIIEKVFKFEPIVPLTGDDSEWADHFDDMGTQQNKRCGRVFKDSNGDCYDIDGKVFVDQYGSGYTNKESRVYITFPYTPKTEYIKVTE